VKRPWAAVAALVALAAVPRALTFSGRAAFIAAAARALAPFRPTQERSVPGWLRMEARVCSPG
jgi:hypothetical protein